MTDHAQATQPASAAQRAAALESVLAEQGVLPKGFVDEFTRHAEDGADTSAGG